MPLESSRSLQARLCWNTVRRVQQSEAEMDRAGEVKETTNDGVQPIDLLDYHGIVCERWCWHRRIAQTFEFSTGS
jgi:hypothetical protein